MKTEAGREISRWQHGKVNLVESLLKSPPETGIYYSVERGSSMSPRCDPSITSGTDLWVPRRLETSLSAKLTAIGWKTPPLFWQEFKGMTGQQRHHWQAGATSDNRQWIKTATHELLSCWLMIIDGRIIASSKLSWTRPDDLFRVDTCYKTGSMSILVFFGASTEE